MDWEKNELGKIKQTINSRQRFATPFEIFLKSPKNKEPLSMTEPEETTIGDRIKFIRGSLTKVEFARALGINRNTLLNYETNKGFPDFERLQKIHEKFKVNINWLISGEGKPYLKRLKYPPNMDYRIIKIESRISALEKKAKK